MNRANRIKRAGKTRKLDRTPIVSMELALVPPRTPASGQVLRRTLSGTDARSVHRTARRATRPPGTTDIPCTAGPLHLPPRPVLCRPCGSLLLYVDPVADDPEFELFKPLPPPGFVLPDPPPVYGCVWNVNDKPHQIEPIRHAALPPMPLYLLRLIAGRAELIHDL